MYSYCMCSYCMCSYCMCSYCMRSHRVVRCAPAAAAGGALTETPRLDKSACQRNAEICATASGCHHGAVIAAHEVRMRGGRRRSSRRRSGEGEGGG
jgi:hypothetical protein